MESAARDVDAPRARRRWLALAGWIALWLVARGALVLSLADVFFYGEELEKACAGKAMLDGLGLAHHQLAYHYYEGGGFVVSHLDALAFAVPLLGPSLLSVKLVALALGAAVLVAGWGLCARAGGLAAARVFALLFVFAPASVQANSLLALGIHFQALLFVALILAFTIRLAFEREQRLWTWALWGASSGFGVFFSYQCVVTVALSAVVIAWTRRSTLIGRPGVVAMAGFAAGLAPLLWMAVNVGGAVFDIHGAALVTGSASKLDTLTQFATSVFAGRGWPDLLSLALLITAPWLVISAVRERQASTLRASALLVAAHAALFLLAYIASGFTVGKVVHYFWLHRLAPLWFLGIVAVAIGFAAAHRSPRKELRLAGWFCVIGMAALGALDAVRLVRDAAPWELGTRTGKLRQFKGYSYPDYLQKLAVRLEGTRASKLSTMLRFREEDPELLHEGIAIALYGDGKATLEEMRAEVRDAGVANDAGFVRGFGNALRSRLGGDIVARAAAVQAEASPTRELLFEAIGRSGDRLIATQDRVRREIQLALDARLAPELLRGLGSRLHDARGDLALPHYFDMRHGPLSLDRRRAYELIDEFAMPASRELMHGYDAAHLRHWLDGYASDSDSRSN